MAKDEIHIVMVPWSAFGHILPFFHLSIALAKSGVKISFISTPSIINRLPQIPQDFVHLINLIKFPFPELDDGDEFPEGAEATVDLPSEKIGRLKIVYDLLQHPVKQFVADQKPDWIVIDLIPHWMVDIADEYGVALMYFYVGSAASMLFLKGGLFLEGDIKKRSFPNWESMSIKPDWVDLPSSVAYTKHEANQVFDWIYGENDSGISDAERISKISIGCHAVAVRSCPEIEGEYLNTLGNLLGKPVIPAGLLPPEKPKSAGELSPQWSQVFKWLGQQSPKSVVYVSFGSEFKLSKDQIFEIAYGLELSGLPFLWALRKPSWANSDLDALPDGFSDRISGKGIVSMGWAPQMEILGHPSIGGTLFHSGWGSIIEMLQFGHSLVLLPFIIDQPLNARLMVEKSLGVEVERNEEDGSFSRDGICKALKLAMVCDEGKIFREKASEAAEIFGNHKLHQDHYIHELAEFLRNKIKS